MKRIKKILANVLFISSFAILLSFDLPSGWERGGSAPESYDMGFDVSAGMNGKNAASIKSKTNESINGFGELDQVCKADKFRGKKVKMSGYMKTKDVKAYAGFWFRADDKKNQIAFDNMAGRLVKKTTDWKKYEITLEIPSSAEYIMYGAYLHGTGQIWFTDIHIEIVGDMPKVADYTQGRIIVDEPSNLDFSK